MKTSLQIAPPGNRLAVRLEFETGEAGDWPVGPVLAGNPLRIVESQRSGLDRDHFVDVEQLLLGLGGIHRERNRFAGQQRVAPARTMDCNQTKE